MTCVRGSLYPYTIPDLFLVPNQVQNCSDRSPCTFSLCTYVLAQPLWLSTRLLMRARYFYTSFVSINQILAVEKMETVVRYMDQTCHKLKLTVSRVKKQHVPCTTINMKLIGEITCNATSLKRKAQYHRVVVNKWGHKGLLFCA